MVHIYGLFADQLCLYVGSTIRSLKKRESEHKIRTNQCGSRNIPKEYEWGIRLLEECSIEDRVLRERHWMTELTPFYNDHLPGRGNTESVRAYRLRLKNKRL